MKILFLFPHFLSPGGAANVVLQFARALQAKQHKVIVCCAKVSKEFKQANPDIIFTELKVPASNSFFFWLVFPYWQIKINRQLRVYKEYILFPHVLPSNWWAWLFKRENRNAKIVWYCHEPSAFIHSSTWINAIPIKLMKWGAKILNPFLKKADVTLEKENDAVICNSEFTKKQYQKIYRSKVDAVIYPPCNGYKRFEKSKENYILTVGRLSKFKNVDFLIKAFKRVSENLAETKLVVVGGGEEKQRLEQLSCDLSLESRVFFKGKVKDDDLALLYQKAKITVICSVEEPFGLVPVESMICSTPVIAHNSGGPKETVLHGITGFLYNDETELTQYIQQVFAMEESGYWQMQQNCIQEATRFDISNSIVQLESVFHGINSHVSD
jgi:glycosyltransferase involved in cell wall biosynthesis